MQTAIDPLVEDIFRAVKGYVSDEFTARFDAFARAIDDRLKSIQTIKGEPGQDGKDGAEGRHGIDGKSGIDGKDGRDGEKGIEGKQGLKGDAGEKGDPGDQGIQGVPGDRGDAGKDGQNGEKGEPGLNGKDGADGVDGKDGSDGLHGKDGRDGIDGKDGAAGLNGKDGAPGADGQKGADGVNGRDGSDGIDGKDGANGIDGQKGIDGKDGIRGEKGDPGLDGRSFTVEDVRPMLEGEVAKWALDFERRAGDLLQKAIDRIPTPKDGTDGINGRDGRDGIDGLGFDDLSIEKSGDRSIAWVLRRGTVEKRFEHSYPVALDAGVYQAGKKDYEAGDGVTYGGSWWIAQMDRPSEAPGKVEGEWRLAVKRGRDGKDAV